MRFATCTDGSIRNMVIRSIGGEDILWRIDMQSCPSENLFCSVRGSFPELAMIPQKEH